jgi:hypothetical protein
MRKKDRHTILRKLSPSLSAAREKFQKSFGENLKEISESVNTFYLKEDFGTFLKGDIVHTRFIYDEDDRKELTILKCFNYKTKAEEWIPKEFLEDFSLFLKPLNINRNYLFVNYRKFNNRSVKPFVDIDPKTLKITEKTFSWLRFSSKGEAELFYKHVLDSRHRLIKIY